MLCAPKRQFKKAKQRNQFKNPRLQTESLEGWEQLQRRSAPWAVFTPIHIKEVLGKGEGTSGFWMARRDQRWLKVTCAGPRNHSGAPAWTLRSWISGVWLWNIHLHLWPLKIGWDVGRESLLSWSGAWKKTSFLNITNIETLSRCHFPWRQSPSAAEEVVGRTTPRLNSRFNADVSRVKITAVSHLHLSTCRRSETIHHNYNLIVIVALCDSDM